MGQVRLCRAVCLGPPQPHPRLQAQAGRKVTRHGNVNFQRPLTDFFYFYFIFFYQEGFKRKMGFQWLRKCREEKKQAIGKRAASMLLKKKKEERNKKKEKRKRCSPVGLRECRGYSQILCALQASAEPLGARLPAFEDNIYFAVCFEVSSSTRFMGDTQ